MRKSTSIAAAAVAVLALTLTGCGGDDKDSGSPAKGGKATGQTTGKRDTTSSPSADASPSPSRTGGAKTKKKESPGTSASPRPTRTSAAPAPAPSRTRTATAAPTRPAGAPQSVQGTWYVPVRGSNGLATLSVSGTSWTMAYSGQSCSGTINAAMAISASCQGESATGRAVVSNGGENLTFNWNSGEPDRFVRTKPTG
ncbi:hypothetical protein HUT19_14845 [Streptomyces sp. NA02950]|uniref:hypothetical protein n=1 Tax=Streptomyces sp. NA02950 TaxID=2742137 RepID=UPI0015906577|nr:hypothetical protein [Streptomyces sp. NA02950]QKV92874.1 hypothetical protein HUT19_14845 [Streptomyces sp. NA02950]